MKIELELNFFFKVFPWVIIESILKWKLVSEIAKVKISVPKNHPIAGQNLSLRTSVQELGAGKVKAR